MTPPLQQLLLDVAAAHGSSISTPSTSTSSTSRLVSMGVDHAHSHDQQVARAGKKTSFTCRYNRNMVLPKAACPGVSYKLQLIYFCSIFE